MQLRSAPPTEPTESTTRICTKCGENKVLENFALCRAGTDEYRPWCKGCWNGYQAERRRKKRKKQLRSDFFAIGRSKNLRGCELLCKALISRFGGLDCVSRELVACLRGMDKGSPSSFKFMTSVWKLAAWADRAKAERGEQYNEAIGMLDGDEIIEAVIEPELAAMADRGELVSILKRLKACRKLDLEELK